MSQIPCFVRGVQTRINCLRRYGFRCIGILARAEAIWLSTHDNLTAQREKFRSKLNQIINAGDCTRKFWNDSQKSQKPYRHVRKWDVFGEYVVALAHGGPIRDCLDYKCPHDQLVFINHKSGKVCFYTQPNLTVLVAHCHCWEDDEGINMVIDSGFLPGQRNNLRYQYWKFIPEDENFLDSLIYLGQGSSLNPDQ